ncbi:hypothetical protein KM043_002737 [Ampulex compressa]|nr:hypothetical protein KM043_002737 [Ampulex compressa]
MLLRRCAEESLYRYTDVLPSAMDPAFIIFKGRRSSKRTGGEKPGCSQKLRTIFLDESPSIGANALILETSLSTLSGDDPIDAASNFREFDRIDPADVIISAKADNAGSPWPAVRGWQMLPSSSEVCRTSSRISAESRIIARLRRQRGAKSHGTETSLGPRSGENQDLGILVPDVGSINAQMQLPVARGGTRAHAKKRPAPPPDPEVEGPVAGAKGWAVKSGQQRNPDRFHRGLT